VWNPFKSKKAEVLSHWYALVPDFETSTQDFYAEVEKELESRKVPGLEISRVDFSEGGILSAKREYLRMARERLVFDICAAPFGTSYFFSLRFAELPSVVSLLQIAVFFFGVLFTLFIFWKIFGVIFGTFLLLVGFAGLIFLLRNAVAMGMSDLDATLLKLPVVGPVYGAFFRKETYYRADTRFMYLETVDAIVKAKVEKATSAKGIQLLSIKQHAPLMDDLYKPVTLPPKPPK
jgi:hypothetical protein